MEKKQKRYSVDFKYKVVQVYLESGKTQPEICDEYGISRSSLIKWTKQPGALLSLPTLAFASDTIQAYLSPSRVLFHFSNAVKEIDISRDNAIFIIGTEPIFHFELLQHHGSIGQLPTCISCNREPEQLIFTAQQN